MGDYTDLAHYFGDRPEIETSAMGSHVGRLSGVTEHSTDRGMHFAANLPKPMSFLHPMTPYGDSYTPSYTRYLNSPGSSYTNPLFPLFNDRRPQAPKIRTSLTPSAREAD